MVFTIHRYIFREAFRIFVLATVALTLILSLGSILRPIQEYGLGPRQVVHLMGYFLPITLTFVLPMAALFASALVYGRFAGDNELDACRASGISLLTLVYPGLALAIMVAIANLILSFYVMPAFVLRSEKALKTDAKQILFRSIQQKGYYKSPDGKFIIYADYADSKESVLSGVLVAEVKAGVIKKVIVAESAKVNFSMHGGYNQVQVLAHNTYQMGSEDQGWFFFEWLPVTKEFPPLLRDDIKFKKIDEMKKIRVDPMRFFPIERMARQTYAQFTMELLAQDITDKLSADSKPKQHGSTDDVGTFYRLHSGRKFVDFTAKHCDVKEQEKIELSGKVVVVEYDAVSNQFLHTLQCTKALLHIEGDELAPTLTLDLYNPTQKNPDGSEDLKMRHIIHGLVLPKAVTDQFKSEDVLQAVSTDAIASALKKGPSPELKNLHESLQRSIQRALLNLKAEIHSRLVFGIGCIFMILIGIGLGIIIKGGHLLTAFGTSCIPAGILIVCILAGKNIAENLGSKPDSGITLMWAGLLFLVLLTGLIYRKLTKN